MASSQILCEIVLSSDRLYPLVGAQLLRILILAYEVALILLLFRQNGFFSIKKLNINGCNAVKDVKDNSKITEVMMI